MRETDSHPTLRLGFWSALLYAFLLVAFAIALIGGTVPPAGGWVGIAAYARYHSPVDFVASAIGLPLVLVFLVVLAGVQHHSDGPSKVWSLLAVVLGAIHAALVSGACFLQLGVVWPGLARGAAAAVEALTLANPYSPVQALFYFAWGLGGLAFLCAGLCLREPGLQRLAGWLWMLNGLVNLALVPLWVLRRDLVLYVAGPSWALLLPLAAVLLAAIYRRAARVRGESGG